MITPTSRLPRLSGLALGIATLILVLYGSIVLGHAETTPAVAWDALFHYDGSAPHVIIRTVRVPRSLIALTVGASLAVAGALMQALTRNPLAAPGILGVNAGAAAAVVAAAFWMKAGSLSAYAWYAFAGAGLASAVVYGLAAAGRSGMTPLKLTVAGAAVTALLTSLTQAILVVHERTLDEIRFWLAGSVAGRDLALFLQVLPYALAGLLLAFLLSRQLTVLGLGDDVAAGLGLRTGWVKAAAALAVVLLAGSAVAVAGPIGFIGLAVPHISRSLAGTDYRWVLPYAAVLGAALLVAADVAARFVLRPEEVPVGVMTALMGAPFFIHLARKGVRAR